MSVEFIGFISNNNSSETIVRSGPVLDPTHIETVAKAHELAGFDRALLAFHSTTPDALQIGQHVLGITRKLKVMVAQRPGFTAPTLLALWTWDEAEFLRRSEGSAIRRIGFERWQRNLAVGLGNALRTGGDGRIVAALRGRREGASALVREHIDWALAQAPGGAA